MNTAEALKVADTYLEEHWEDIIADIETLVRIPSFKEAEKADLDAPWGPGPKAGLEAGLAIAERMGFRTHNLNGYIGWADLKGAGTAQIGIIGHMDVVPAGPGWTFPPYEVTRKDGFLIGRGVDDDKGPSMIALHAVNALAKAWAADAAEEAEFAGMREYTEEGLPLVVGAKALTAAAQEREKIGKLPHTVRFIFGADEECGMGDIPYYRAAQPDPVFVFTPDANFPVCYGEKGHYDATVVSAPIDGGCIVAFEGGQAANAVAGQARCVVRASCVPAGTDAISVTDAGEGAIELFAQGRSAHAASPGAGINAIGLLCAYLLELDQAGVVALSEAERDFLQFEGLLMASVDGASLDLQVCDDEFGPLTIVGGLISMEEGRLIQTVDSRYPTTITADQISAKLAQAAARFGAVVADAKAQPPFISNANSPEVRALNEAYCEVTGDEAKPFTMAGGTYAREFSNAVSFGPAFPVGSNLRQQWPSWVGSMHGPDEGVSEFALKNGFRIYVLALAKLMDIPL